jgi:FtsP/CotA-like multicopper oxidase with cupredoxin domain
MSNKGLMRCLGTLVLLLVCGAWMAEPSPGATINVYLRVDATTKTIDGTAIPMWEYANCHADSTFTSCDPPAVPGPTLNATQGDTLILHIKNNLTGPFTEPTSVIIPGQTTTLNPTWVNGTTGAVVSVGSRLAGDVTSRMRSFTTETPVGGVGTYTWPSLRAGTYLYQSGTHQAVQVQMGLYGALKVNVVAGRAYTPTLDNPNTAFDAEVVLLFSEIDLDLHNAVGAGTYGPNPAPPVGWMTSTVHYQPKYFLMNGDSYSPGLSPIPAGTPNQRVLVRVLNAGLLEKTPTFLSPYFMNLIAEDGNLLPFSKLQYHILLPAGKTMDAIFISPTAGYIPVYDRSLSLSNGTKSPGGMLRYLQVASPSQVTLTINRIGVGTVIGAGVVQATSLPAGIDCGIGGSVCTQSYNPGITMKLTASWKNGSAFLGWGGACTGTQQDCILTLTGNTTVTAAFEPTLVGLFRSGAWYLDRNGNGQWNGCATDLCVAAFGGFVGDIPIAGDWTGLDGRAKIGTYRHGEWFLDTNGNGVWDPGADRYIPAFGGFSGDIPVMGDWNATGIMKVGTYRNGEWFLDTNGNGVWDPGVDRYIPAFGGFSGDIPVTGDWNGTGVMKIGIYRNGQWFLDLTGNGVWDGCGADGCFPAFGGLAVDIPVTGAW